MNIYQVAFLLPMSTITKSTNRKQTQVYAQLKAKYLDYYSKLPIQKLAAEFIGKDEDTIIRWKKEDRGFADQVASAKSAWALEKAGKVRSTEWLLERVLNEHFTEKKNIEIDTNEKLDAALDVVAKWIP